MNQWEIVNIYCGTRTEKYYTRAGQRLDEKGKASWTTAKDRWRSVQDQFPLVDALFNGTNNFWFAKIIR